MSNLIELPTPEGQQLLKDVQAKSPGSLFQPTILSIFAKQKGNQNCGIQSCALLLGASHVAKSALPDGLDNLPFTEAKMFSFPETLSVRTQEQIESDGGCTLEEVYNILKNHSSKLGYTVEMHHAADSSVEEFCALAKAALSRADSSSGVIVNYHMNTLGQGPLFGHHSPLAGYHEATERFLIMDTWAATKECWAKPEDIFRAMNTVDNASGKTRGFVVMKTVA